MFTTRLKSLLPLFVEKEGVTVITILIDLLVGAAIGLTLGLLGGGGSILTVPALVYLVGQSPQMAVTASLIIVGANSLLGAYFHRAQGTLNWRVALTFGGVGMIAAYWSAGLSHLFSSTMLLILFALLMIVVGALMILRKTPTENASKPHSWPATLLSGAGVGILTGFLGVGGGFLIVPALVMLVGLPMRQAVGTSLVIIAMNSLAGLLGHLGQTSIDYVTITLFVVAGLGGTFLGTALTKVIRAEQLRRLFAGFVIVLALFLLYDNVPKLLPIHAKETTKETTTHWETNELVKVSASPVIAG
ncbi:MAG: sulfite exporter TauE/SafE family protein [Caldilinea sp. CFX5]|nr:sulfite exporter TauE/SafE family protein [Caldilinea sp. CFX5]